MTSRARDFVAGQVGKAGVFLCGMCAGYAFIPNDAATWAVLVAGGAAVSASSLLDNGQREEERQPRCTCTHDDETEAR